MATYNLIPTEPVEGTPPRRSAGAIELTSLSRAFEARR